MVSIYPSEGSWNNKSKPILEQQQSVRLPAIFCCNLREKLERYRGFSGSIVSLTRPVKEDFFAQHPGQATQPSSVRNPEQGERRSLSSFIWEVVPSALSCAGGTPRNAPFQLYHLGAAVRSRVYAAGRSPTSCRAAARRDNGRSRPSVCLRAPIHNHPCRGRPCAWPLPPKTGPHPNQKGH